MSGDNMSGQLGVGSHHTFAAFPCLVEDLRSMRVRKLSCGSKHTVAIIETGEVFAWGANNFGMLGNGCFETE